VFSDVITHGTRKLAKRATPTKTIARISHFRRPCVGGGITAGTGELPRFVEAADSLRWASRFSVAVAELAFRTVGAVPAAAGWRSIDDACGSSVFAMTYSPSICATELLIVRPRDQYTSRDGAKSGQLIGGKQFQAAEEF